MNKDYVLQAVKNFRTHMATIEKELKAIDPDLREEVRQQRTGQVWERHGKKVKELFQQVRAGREHFHSVRAASSDPLKGLFKAAYQRDLKAQEAALLENLDVFPPEDLVELCREYGNPHFVLKSMKIINSHKFEDYNHQGFLQDRLKEMAGQFVQKDQVREAAGVELATLRAELDYLNTFGGNAENKLSLGRMIAEAEKHI